LSSFLFWKINKLFDCFIQQPLSPTIMLEHTVDAAVWARTSQCKLSSSMDSDPDCDKGIAKYSLNAGLSGGLIFVCL
jgi:hypothetical protein